MTLPLLPPATTRWADGLQTLADQYDGFVVDQFGVLHDGRQAYAGAADALARLRARGARVIVLSNSGKRAKANAQRLRRFGIGPEHLDAIVTSGELLVQMLQQRDRAPFQTLGPRVWLGCPQEDAATLQGLPYQVVADVGQADWLLLASLADVPDAAAALQPALDSALARALPVLCANPDLQRLSARGVEPSVGAAALRHEQRGGQVVWLGKPHGLIYTVCREALGRWGSRRFLAVGDSLAHDVAGGAAAGCDTCFIAAGLHAADFADDLSAGLVSPQPRASPAAGVGSEAEAHRPGLPAGHSRRAHQALQTRLQDLLAAHPGLPPPTWALPTLRW